MVPRTLSGRDPESPTIPPLSHPSRPTVGASNTRSTPSNDRDPNVGGGRPCLDAFSTLGYRECRSLPRTDHPRVTPRLGDDEDPETDFTRAPLGAPAVPQKAPLPMMTRPTRYALRMAVFLVAVAIIAVMLHEHAERFFQRNPPLNTLILSVLGLGIALSFRAVLSLDPAVAWIERYRTGDAELFHEAGPPLLDPLAIVLKDAKGRLTLTTAGMRSVLDGIDSRLDERRDTSRYLIALLIFLGLLGTFWGLLLTANSVGETIRGLNVTGTDPAQMFETLRAGLEAPLSGMGTAFSTSLFGLASSLVLGFLDLQASQAQNRFANDLETWLSRLAQPESDIVRDESKSAPSYVTALLQQTAEGLDRLERRMVRAVDDDASLQAALRTIGDRLTSLTEELRTTNRLTDRGGDTQRDTKAELTRIANLLEHQAGGLDEVARAQVKTLELSVGRLIEDGARGRDRAVTEIRDEIRLLARTLSVIADRER